MDTCLYQATVTVPVLVFTPLYVRLVYWCELSSLSEHFVKICGEFWRLGCRANVPSVQLNKKKKNWPISPPPNNRSWPFLLNQPPLDMQGAVDAAHNHWQTQITCLLRCLDRLYQVTLRFIQCSMCLSPLLIASPISVFTMDVQPWPRGLTHTHWKEYRGS